MGSLTKNNVATLYKNSIAQLSFALLNKDINMVIVHLAELLSLIFANKDVSGNTYFWTKYIIQANSNSLFACIVAIRNDVIAHANNSKVYMQLKPLMSKYYKDSVKLLEDKNADNVIITALTFLNDNIDRVFSMIDSNSIIEFNEFAAKHGMSFEDAFKRYSDFYKTTDIGTIVNTLKEDSLL